MKTGIEATSGKRVCTIALSFLSTTVLLALSGPVAALRAQEMILELPRHAYLRGEEIPVAVRVPREVADGRLEAFLEGGRKVSTPFRGTESRIRIPTDDIRVGRYALKAVVEAGPARFTASAEVTVARRPAGDRLEVWLWSMGGGDVGFYYDHGFTIAGGPAWTYWREEDRRRQIDRLDARLPRGGYATIGPCGGIQRSDLRNVDSTAAGVAYLGAGRHAERFWNPYSPEVERLRAENNRRLFEAVGDHPALKVAFFNTEIVDDLWLDNLNPEGIERTRARLGFTRDERGKPTFLAPGVIPDDDRGYVFQKYVFTEGNGVAYANARTAEDVKTYRPDLLTLTDPYRQVAFLDMFPGLDLVGTWTYTNNDPKLMLYVETLRALTRGTGARPLQTVTLLNYPGTLIPRSVTGDSGWLADRHNGWLLMGPDRCKEVSWIILSRAPRAIGYYFSSACDPEKFSRPEDQVRVPSATADAIRELSDRVYRPYGKLITRLDVARRRIAVLSSQASRLYGKTPRTIGYPNEQIYGFYSAMAMAHLDGDVLFDEQVARGALRDYDLLALPACGVVTRKMHEEILAFARRGGIVIADAHLGPEIPGALKFDFDFTYRLKVNADAIQSGVTYAEWDDHLNPKTAELTRAKGVTAEDDQRVMESYARRLGEGLAGRVVPEVSTDSPRTLVSVLEWGGMKVLALVNDHRGYDERTGKYRAIMEKLLPRTATVTVRQWSGPAYVYDMLERKPLSVRKSGKGFRFEVNLDELGGRLVAVYPARPSRIEIRTPGSPARARRTEVLVAVRDDRGRELAGLQPLRVTVTDASGRDTEYTDYYCAENGRLLLPLRPAVNDEAGSWRIAVEDLAAGLRAERAFTVE